MSELVVPSTRPGRTGRTPTIHEYVNSFLTKMRAPLREATTFTPAGRTTLHRPGERIIFAPTGEPIRVIELPEGGNQVEHGDHLHAHVRAKCVSRNLEVLGVTPGDVERARRPDRRTIIALGR